MKERSRFMDDLAGVAQGAISALAGVKDEAEAVMRARIDDTVQRLDLVRGEQLAAVQELAANARAGQEAAESQSAALTARVLALEARLAASPAVPAPVAADPGDAAAAVMGSGS
jgi:BMFP domain-containing protein YqiC